MDQKAAAPECVGPRLRGEPHGTGERNACARDMRLLRADGPRALRDGARVGHVLHGRIVETGLVARIAGPDVGRGIGRGVDVRQLPGGLGVDPVKSERVNPGDRIATRVLVQVGAAYGGFSDTINVSRTDSRRRRRTRSDPD